MASRELRVSFVSDTKALERGFARAESRTQKFGQTAGRVGLLLGGTLAVGMGKAVIAAADAQKSQAALEAQLKASGTTYSAHASQIDAVIQKHSQLAGIDDEELQGAFTRLVRASGDVNKAMAQMGTVTDIARARNIDASKAGDLLAKVMAGNVSALNRYGAGVEKGATVTEALATIQRRFSGQAEAYGRTAAGAQDRFRVAVENLQEAMGRGLLPIVTKVANGIGNLSRWAERNQTTFKALVAVAGTLAASLLAISVATKVAAALGTLRAATLALNAAMRANPVGAVITVLAALGVALVAAYKKSETFRTVVNGVFNAVKSVVVGAIDRILGAFSTYLDGIAKLARAAGKIPGIGGKFNDLARAAENGANKINRVRDAMREVKSKTVDLRVNVGFYKGGKGGLTPISPSAEKMLERIASGAAASIRGPNPNPGPSLGTQTALAQNESMLAMLGTGVVSGLLPSAEAVRTSQQTLMKDRISTINRRQHAISGALKSGRGWKGWKKQNAKQRKATLRRFQQEFLALEQEEAGLWNSIGSLNPDTGGGGTETEAERIAREQLEQDQRQHEELLAAQQAEAAAQAERDAALKESQDAANRLQAEANERMAALQEEIKRQNNFAESVNAVSTGVIWKALADLVSGQIGGIGYSGRALTASAGSVVRY